MVSFETPSGWCTVVHGRRPPPEVWPKQQWIGVGNVLSPTSQQLATRPPSQRFHDVGIVEAASPVHQPRQKFTQPQSTVALGVGSEEAKGLEAALVRAKRGANLVPVGECLDSTAQFVERCKKRLQSAEPAVQEAVVSQDKAVAELEAGQRNLETLRAEAAAQAQEPRIQPTAVSDESDQVSSLKARISLCGSRHTREIESDGEHDCKGRQFGTEFEQVQPKMLFPR